MANVRVPSKDEYEFCNKTKIGQRITTQQIADMFGLTVVQCRPLVTALSRRKVVKPIFYELINKQQITTFERIK